MDKETTRRSGAPRKAHHDEGSMLNRILTVIILVSLTLLVFCSCRSSRVPQLPPSLVLHDSVRVEIRERLVHIHDTVTIPLPQQSVSHSAADSSSHLETTLAESDVRILPDGTLLHTLRNRPGALKAPVDLPCKVRDSLVYRDRDVPVPVPYPVEKELSWWQQLKMKIGGVCIIFSLILCIFLFFGFWKRIR